MFNPPPLHDSCFFSLASPSQIDHWLDYSVSQLSRQNFTEDVLSHLDAILAPRVYLVGHNLSLADIAVYGSLRGE